MTIRPVSDHIVAVPLRPKTKTVGADTVTDGGIVIPETAEEKEGMVPMVAQVMAVGPGKPHPVTGELVPVSCNPGDRIVYRAPYGNFSKFNLERPFLILEEKDILAVLEDNRIVEVAA